MAATIGTRLRRYYVAGILVLAPTALTLWVVWKLFRFFDDILGTELRARGISVLGLGFVLLNVVLLAPRLHRDEPGGQAALRPLGPAHEPRAPINKIYATLRQIAELLLGPSRVGSFGRVAIVEFPSPGTWGLGFVTSTVAGEASEKTGKRLCSLFIPSAVNPTTGFLLVVPEEKVTYLEMTPEQAMKMIVSAGALVPSAALIAPFSSPSAAAARCRAWRAASSTGTGPPRRRRARDRSDAAASRGASRARRTDRGGTARRAST